MSARENIVLRGVAVHNLKQIDLDLPRGRLIAFCGVSGSGKSSLAFDTLYAEGQRRYIESFSAYTRQFLERLEKPAAERIEGIPPAIAVARAGSNRSSRSTIGTFTETTDHLRLLYSRIARTICPDCGILVDRETAQSAADVLAALPSGARFFIAFAPSLGEDSAAAFASLKEAGFVRLLLGDDWINLAHDPLEAVLSRLSRSDGRVWAVVDRLTVGEASAARLHDSLEQAFEQGAGQCSAFVPETAFAEEAADAFGPPSTIAGEAWRQRRFFRERRCQRCGREFPEPTPNLFSFNSPLGACPKCEGFGNVSDIDPARVVPNERASLREGAVAPWNTPAYAHELGELVALAPDYDLRLDVPYAELTDAERQLVWQGVSERNFGGLRGFFAWLERRKYKMHIRVFLSRWRSYRVCEACLGSRLRPEALASRVEGLNIAELHALKIRDAAALLESLVAGYSANSAVQLVLAQVLGRLGYLAEVGLGYLALDRTLRTLSSGEVQRVALTTALGSSLVNMLYVLDEPSMGLHPRDTDRLFGCVRRLRDRGNTVVVVEHEETLIRGSDQVVEIGPGAGERGGHVVFQGSPEQMLESPHSLTGDFLSGRRQIRLPVKRRAPEHGWIRLAGARGNNLKNLTVEFPLGLLCVVTGVSGAGKSSLVQGTLYPALCRRMRKEVDAPLDLDDVFGDGQLDDVLLVDQSPIGRSPRSNPVTYLKAFDEIRAVFAATLDARAHNYTPSHFSFNSSEGRCETCEGDGYIQTDMQFLADVYLKCAECQGRRYRRDILDVRYRGRNIADVLELTVREAFSFFRGHPKVQSRLKRLIDVGLDYLRLGQPANTLSGGEAQRLKLAAYISSARRGRCLFLLDEPTTGLHFADIVQLLDCFDALLAVGHSLIVIEHNLHLIKCADYLIDLGPGAADDGGRIVVSGTPEMVSRHPDSITGRYLAEALREAASAPDAETAQLS